MTLIVVFSEILLGFFIILLSAFTLCIVIDLLVPIRRSIPARIIGKTDHGSRRELLDSIGGLISGVRSPSYRLIIQAENDIGSVYVSKAQHQAAEMDAEVAIDYRLGRLTKNLYIEKIYV